MKIRTRHKTLLAVAVVIVAAVVMTGVQLAVAEDDGLPGAMANLSELGVPVKAAGIQGTRAVIALQSASTTSVGTPDDPIFLSQVQREIFLAKSRGLAVTELDLTMTNAKGELLFAGIISLDTELEPSWSAFAKVSEADTAAMVRADLTARTDLAGLTLESVAMDTEVGARVLRITAVAADMASANKSTASMMINLYNVINDANRDKGAQIVVARVDITDKSGAPLLKWIYDAQRGAQDWWQAPGMTTDWFETPAPAGAADSK